MKIFARSLIVIACWAAPFAALAQSARPRTTSEMLVDRARDTLVGRRGERSAADLALARVFLRAAARVDPAAVDALSALHELESIAGDPDAVRAVLDELVRIDPAHETAFARWLAQGPPGPQTRETVQAWLQSLLTRPLSPPSMALVHTRLADQSLQQLDRESAAKHIAEGRRICPDCPEPAALALRVLPASAAGQERLGAILSVLRTDPAAVEAAWQGAFLLDDLEFHADAQLLYEHAFHVHARRHPGQRPPIECFLRAAENALVRGQRDAAVAILGNVGDPDATDLATAFWAGELFERVGLRERAKGVRAMIDPVAAAIAAAPDSVSVERVAQAAWNYVAIDTRTERALALAEAALRREPGNIVATRALGWAQAIASRHDEARETLAKVAADDAFATAKLADVLRKAGDDAGARRVLSELRDPPTQGFAREYLIQVGYQPASSQPAERRPEIADALKAFDRGVFEFDSDPAKFFDVGVEIEDLSPEPGQPWRATFTLTSRASFSIPLGSDGLINPVFLLSFRVDADQSRDFPALFAVNLDCWGFLAPGATLRVKRTLDVGPLRAQSQRYPQHSIRITLLPLFDPAMTADGRWVPSPTGRDIRPVSLTRRPVDAGPEGMDARLAALSSESPPARFIAMETLASLLGEAQRHAVGRSSSASPQRIPVERVSGMLRAALAAESWETRVRALDALSAAGLDAPTVNAALDCAKHPHWLVRLMSLRLLARQGRAFADDARRFAESDADPLVRDMARAIVGRLDARARLDAAAPASRPAPVTQPLSGDSAPPGE